MAAQTPISGCPHHPRMGFICVCKSCDDQLICMECITDSHNGHTVGKLTDYVAGHKRAIQQYFDKLSKSDIPKIEGNIHEWGQYDTTTNDGFYQKMIEDIRRQGKKMKQDTDTIIDMLVRLFSELKEKNACIFERNKTALSKYLREDLKAKLDRCQEVLTSGTAVDVTTLARDIRTTSTPAPPTLESLQTVGFKPGTISTGLLKRMLGKLLVDGANWSFQPIPKCVVLSEFQTSFPYDSCRTCPTDDEAWLSYWSDENIYRVDLKGNVKETIECNVKVKSIAVSPTTGRVWFCVRDDLGIREITSGGDIVTQFSVNNAPWSLCITSDDMIVFGMKGGIQLYTTDGRAVPAGVGGPCRQVAESPAHLTSCTLTGDVAAVDFDGVTYKDYMAGKKSDKQPGIIVMDKHLNRKFHIKDIGPSKTQGSDIQPSKFYPYAVSFDGAGDVLVADGVTKSVVLIDMNTGHYIRTFYTSEEDVPRCISLHEDSIFWVGHKGRKMKIIQYK